MNLTKTPNSVEQAMTGIENLDKDPALKATAVRNLERWLTDDLFADAHPQLEWLIENERFDDLFDAFYQQIPFGTGGRRGRVGFGTNRLNPFTIATSIQGHCEFLKKHLPGRDLSVVVAYDVRVFRDLKKAYDNDLPNPLRGQTSLDFAQIAASVYAANGVTAWFNAPDCPRFISTPELSFAIRELGAQGGLNISASHNHPDDNGAKIYNALGGQEIPPLDEEMASIVESIESAQSISFEDAVSRGLVKWLPPSIHENYIAMNVGVSLNPQLRSARIVFTPLHGTGWSSVGETLQKAGFNVECLESQSRPDGEFPTVPFRSPNPEVPESLLKASEHAAKVGADLVLAADPDADRLGLMVPDSSRGWQFVNGNQIGVLLADYIIQSGAANSKRRPFCLTTVVTTSLFRRIVEDDAVQCVSDLLIGFKYIAETIKRVAEDGRFGEHIEASEEDFLLGIEESHGYLVTGSVRDKDAAGAAILLCELVSRLKNDGRSVLEHLDDVYRRFGYVSNVLRSTVMEGADGHFDIEKIQTSLRQNPPDTIGSLKVESFIDRQDQSRFGPFLSETDRAARDILTFQLERDVRVVLRPSGTEPKNKCYVEVCSRPVGDSQDPTALDENKNTTDAIAQRVARDFLVETLSRIGVCLPGWALDVSDLVALGWKQHFCSTFLPELVQRLGSGEAGPELEQWIDRSLEPYGSDGRLLVRGGVRSYLRDENPEPSVHTALQLLFSLRENEEETK